MRRLLVALLALSPLGAAQAHAQTYTTSTCKTPAGTAATSQGWTQQGSAAMAARDACKDNIGLTFDLTTATVAAEDSKSWVFTAPADTRLVGYTLWRTIRPSSGSGWGWGVSIYRDVVSPQTMSFDESCRVDIGCSGRGDGTLSDASKFSRSGFDSGSLILHGECSPGPCPQGIGLNLLLVNRADFTLRDSTDPTLTTTPSGDLFDTAQPLTGVRSTSFAAADQGGGVYQAILEVDGKPVTSAIVDPNDGRCVPPFTGAIPCKLAASGSLSFDTAALPDGNHAFRLVVTDATGVNAVAYGPVQVRTQNQLAECDPAANSPVSARFKGTRRSAVTRRSGATTVSGRIAGAGAGVTVSLLSRERRSGATATVASTAVTRASGTFTLRVPKGASRNLRAAWRVRATDPYLACSKALTVRVPARGTLRVTPRVVRAGRSIRLSGRLLGGRVPANGKLIDLQAHEAGRWRTFASVRTKTSGAFTARYRFRSSAPRRSYAMRARIRPDAAYPFSVGYTRSVKVRVR
jgi:hypothetical protein